MFEDNDLFVRLAAVSALDEIGGNAAQEALAEACSVENASVARAAKAALHK